MPDAKTNFELNEKICESCGEKFGCGANAEKCWCFEIDLSGETLARLQKNFNNCLCGKCLKNYGETEKQIFERQAYRSDADR